jgi:hypothetical protein
MQERFERVENSITYVFSISLSIPIPTTRHHPKPHKAARFASLH